MKCQHETPDGICTMLSGSQTATGYNVEPCTMEPCRYYEGMNREWISVNDRLPEEGIDAIVYRQSDSVGECVDMAYRQNGCWRGTADGWRLDDVTNWMPLPAPPTPCNDDNGG